jgi:hypothetical protein
MLSLKRIRKNGAVFPNTMSLNRFTIWAPVTFDLDGLIKPSNQANKKWPHMWDLVDYHTRQWHWKSAPAVLWLPVRLSCKSCFLQPLLYPGVIAATPTFSVPTIITFFKPHFPDLM